MLVSFFKRSTPCRQESGADTHKRTARIVLTACRVASAHLSGALQFQVFFSPTLTGMTDPHTATSERRLLGARSTLRALCNFPFVSLTHAQRLTPYTTASIDSRRTDWLSEPIPPSRVPCAFSTTIRLATHCPPQHPQHGRCMYRVACKDVYRLLNRSNSQRTYSLVLV